MDYLAEERCVIMVTLCHFELSIDDCYHTVHVRPLIQILT